MNRLTRRHFALGGLLGGLSAVGLAARIGFDAYASSNPYETRRERVTLPLPPEHEGLDGLTIGFVADTHVGPFVDPATLLVPPSSW